MASYLEEELIEGKKYQCKTYDGEKGIFKYIGNQNFICLSKDLVFWNYGDSLSLLGDLRYAYYEIRLPK